MKIKELLENFKDKNNFLYLKSENYQVLLLPYIYDQPNAIYKSNKMQSWEFMISGGSSSGGGKIKNSYNILNTYLDNKKYLSNTKIYIKNNSQALLDFGPEFEFTTNVMNYLTTPQLLNMTSISEDQIINLPYNEYISSLYFYYVNDVKYYLLLTEDQFYKKTKLYNLSIENNTTFSINESDCILFNRYRDGGTLEISFEYYTDGTPIDIYIPTPFDKNAKAFIKVNNNQIELKSSTDINDIKTLTTYLNLNEKIK